MHGRSQTCTVKNGRIHITCARCAKKKYVPVAPGLRKKSVRCVCGMSMIYTLNHRAFMRESTCGKGLIVLQNGKDYPVYLCDSSLGGIGFNIQPQYARALSCNQDVTIKYRSMGGATVQRKIRIKSIINNRVGTQFLDGYIPSF